MEGVLAPDLGADEFDGIPLDATVPSISYSLIANTTNTSNYSLNAFATITDASGINTLSGTKPRLYFKRSTDANTFNSNSSATDGLEIC